MVVMVSLRDKSRPKALCTDNRILRGKLPLSVVAGQKLEISQRD